jgi:transcriptional regulator with XRE-family HTH domain
MARRHAGLSQAALAKRSAVTASAVAQWERPAGTRPSLDRLQMVATVTGAPLNWLVSGVNAPLQEASRFETPAVVFDVYAETMQEEILLQRFRLLSPNAREHFVALAHEFSAQRRRSRLQRG